MFWTERYTSLGKLYRYCDDFVIVCRTKRDAQQALQTVQQIMSHLKLTLHSTKTRIVDMGQEGFDFLGFHFHKLKSKKTNKLLPYIWPSGKAMKAVREKIRQITTRKRLSNPIQEVIRFLNMVIRGWRNYFRIGNSTKKYQDLDRYVGERLRRWVRSQKGTRGHWNERAFNTLMARCGVEYFFSTGRCASRP
jgi:hypothetical protein